MNIQCPTDVLSSPFPSNPPDPLATPPLPLPSLPLPPRRLPRLQGGLTQIPAGGRPWDPSVGVLQVRSIASYLSCRNPLSLSSVVWGN